MSLTRRSTLAEVAAVVAGALRRAGIGAVLTGGACSTLYSAGAYQSQDLDFVIRSGGTRVSLDGAMASIGFARRSDRYIHSTSPFYVEFPRGPLAIGDDFDIRPVQLRVGGGMTLALSATDACRDRLAAFYHWSDRGSLAAAVAIAVRRRIDRAAVRHWSRAEGFEERFEEFRAELAQATRERRQASGQHARPKRARH